MASEEHARRTLNRFITSFNAALAGPPTDPLDPEVAHIELWATAVVGSNLVLAGWTERHPVFGETKVWTSRLIHITADQKWARTASRWYSLGKPFSAEMEELFPGAQHLEAAISSSPDFVTVPMEVAVRAMADFPNLMTKLAAGSACKDLVPQFEEIEAKWPPTDGVARH
ncbi:DUF6634 family protein [Tropicibacter naphthalenivorans]|uniref:Uncharacterized protein n=1 Tax=Tropicibacter naphthalenivorans TaxID=441103 RepID=A0A0P1FZ81_9RHOB|nr:DUF6634 family protein [Tropicibacter naphthalenivorans]CUH74656.1 hypothetical protein TRN7648_00009 [Tropicibacter naphthalenivorans]SMC50022.1 hypothetical protein SAMN04488093_101871 [Tropicibacter naphthalenivorans]